MGRGRRAWPALLILSLWAGAAADARLTARVEPEHATVGDPLRLTVELDVAPGTDVRPPALGERLGPFGVRESGWEAGPNEAGRRRWFATLVPWQVGALEVPALEFRIVRGGKAESWRTEPLAVEIESVLEAGASDAADLADLKPPASLAPDLTGLWRILAALGALAALAWLARWLYRRLRAKLAAAAPPDPFKRLPAHEWAYAQLQALLASRETDSRWRERFFDELVRILKRYLEARFRVELLEHTTSESVARLAQAGAAPEVVEQVARLLEQADRVKFAREAADERRAQAAVEAAYAVVDATRPPTLQTERAA